MASIGQADASSAGDASEPYKYEHEPIEREPLPPAAITIVVVSVLPPLAIPVAPPITIPAVVVIVVGAADLFARHEFAVGGELPIALQTSPKELAWL